MCVHGAHVCVCACEYVDGLVCEQRGKGGGEVFKQKGYSVETVVLLVGKVAVHGMAVWRMEEDKSGVPQPSYS